MKRLLAAAVAAMLGWTAGAGADELPWRPAGTSPSSGVSLGRPVVSLGRPVIEPSVDPGVKLASFQGPATLARPVVRGQNGDSHSTWASGEDHSGSPGSSWFASTPGAELHATGFGGDGPPVGVGQPMPNAPGMSNGNSPVVSTGPGEGVPPGVPFGGPTSFAADAPCGCGGPGDGGCCCDDSCACCPGCVDCCKHGGCFFGSAEYLLWSIRDQRYPALVTTGSAASRTGVPPMASGGFLGDPTTQILFGGGGQAVHSNEFSGGRFNVGYWFDCEQTKAVEFNYFFLGTKTIHFGADSGQFPVIARPFFDLNNNREFAEFTAFPRAADGRVDVSSRSRMWGAEANLRCRLCCNSCCCDCLDCSELHYHVDVIGGLRYLDLTEALDITEMVRITGPNPQNFPPGTMARVSDRFGTRNDFYGGQVGTNFNVSFKRFSMDLNWKLAMGDVNQVVNINGDQVVTVPGRAAQIVQGGLLALPSNSGRFTRDRFAVVPELGVKLGYNVTDNLTVYVGYTWLYWSNVVRPGNQIDRVIDINQVPNFRTGPAIAGGERPQVLFKGTDFWAQGVSFGLSYNY